MNVPQPNRKLLFAILGPSFILSIIILLIFIAPFNLAFQCLGSLLFLLCLILIITPLGSQRSSLILEETVEPFLSWFIKIILLELALFAVFWGVMTLVGKQLPIHIPTETHVFAHALYHNLVKQSLFPWTGIALICIFFHYFNQHQKKDTFFSTFLGISPQSKFGIVMNTLTRVATVLAMSSTIALICILIIATILPHAAPLLTQGSIVSVILSIALFIFFFARRVKRKIFSFYFKNKISGTSFCLGLIGCITLILLITLLIATYFSSFLHYPNNEKISAFHAHLFLNLLSSLWWMCWIPLMGLYLAKLSRGRSFRLMIVSILVLPSSIAAVAFFHPININPIPTWLVILITLLGFWLLLMVMGSKTAIASMVDMSFHKDPSKFRDSFLLLYKIFQFSYICLIFYLYAGIFMLNFFLMTFGLAIFILTLLILPVFINMIRLHIKNKNQTIQG